MKLAASPAQDQLQAFQDALESFRAGGLTAHALLIWHAARAHCSPRCPEKLSEVLHQLMDRLESSALFSEESCSSVSVT